MKRIDKFTITAFVGPFVAILFVVIFILMMQFLWVYIDELVGKGLGLKVLMEFLFWGTCTIMPLALPLATLLASVMTLGQMGENNELIALKAAGVSLTRVIAPLVIISGLISVGAFFTANNLVPLAYNKIYTLRDDIGKTKEEIKIPSGTFYNGIEGYILRVQSRSDATKMMYEVMVYDHTGGKGNTSLTLADSAEMKMSKTKDYLTFKMFNGTSYQETNNWNYRDTSLQLQKIDFDKQTLVIPLQNYAFQKSDKARFGDQVKAMNLKQLAHGRDSLEVEDSTSRTEFLQGIGSRSGILFSNQLDSTMTNSEAPLFKDEKYLVWDDVNEKIMAYQRASNTADTFQMNLSEYQMEHYGSIRTLIRSRVEFLRKFAQSFACFIMFFIGAPLGALIKKGGLGTPAIVSVLFFVLYWVIDITGTKLARDGAVTAALGVSISTIVLLPTGLFLTWKAINDSALFNFDNFNTWWRRKKSKFMGIFRKTRIVYMGTPEFAVGPLDALIRERYKVVGVVTTPDKPSGRGLKVNESAVKKYAVEHGIPVLQPVKLKDPDFLEQLAKFRGDLFMVVAFRMLPEDVWSMPKLGTINLHAALLPQYRGAAPINWALINGERLTGVTTFMIDKSIDTGGIILRQECRISDSDTAGDIHDRLMEIGSDLVVQTVEGVIEKNVETRVQKSFIQGSEVLKPAPKLTKELCHIDWNDTTADVHNLIRGLSPYPTAYTSLLKEGKPEQELKIFSSSAVTGNEFASLLASCGKTSAVFGDILSDGKSFIAFATADGAILVNELQLSGKKRMPVKDFLVGFREPMSYSVSAGTSKAEIAKTRL